MNFKFNPKISIIIPVYNGSDYLKESIDSALAQTYNNFEVIVVNDGSNDDGKTDALAKSYGDKIKYFLKENGGVSSALNYGIREMTGEYFSWLSHDDKYTPNKITNLVNLLQDCEPYSTVAMTSVTHIDPQGRKIRNLYHSFENKKIYSSKEVMEYMTNNTTLNGCAMIIPKDALINSGGFNEELRYNQDGLMWYNIFHQGYKLIVDTENYDTMYRLHPQQTSKTRRDLLLHDSLELAKIVAPMLITYPNAKVMLKNFAKRYAIHVCEDAVNECIRIGKLNNLFNCFDVINIKLFNEYGKVRQILKKIYFSIKFR